MERASGEGGKEVKQGTGGNGRQLRPGDLDAATADSAKPKTAWSSNERGTDHFTKDALRT